MTSPSPVVPTPSPEEPTYETSTRSMRQSRAPRAAQLAELLLSIAEPFLSRPVADLRVLDVGCGFGDTALELARRCRHVDGLEPALKLVRAAEESRLQARQENLRFQHGAAESFAASATYDLIVLDNVYEHLARQDEALAAIGRALAPGGVGLIVTPNRLWPIEVHYRLPFLSYLPLSVANWYLRRTGRGTDYTDCSYAPTYGGLVRALRRVSGVEFRFVVPQALHLATGGRGLLYRCGAAVLRRSPLLWWISKAFVVVLIRSADTPCDEGGVS